MKPSLFGAEMAFTGPRASDMTPDQRRTVIEILNKMRPCVVYNGCAEGRDEECIDILIEMRLPLTLVCCPANKERLDHIHAKTRGKIRTEWRASGLGDPLKRDRLMVDAAEWLLAVPNSTAPLPSGSGTWYTVKYALRQGVQVVMVWPDGTIDANYGNTPKARSEK